MCFKECLDFWLYLIDLVEVDVAVISLYKASFLFSFGDSWRYFNKKKPQPRHLNCAREKKKKNPPKKQYFPGQMKSVVRQQGSTLFSFQKLNEEVMKRLWMVKWSSWLFCQTYRYSKDIDDTVAYLYISSFCIRVCSISLLEEKALTRIMTC